MSEKEYGKGFVTSYDSFKGFGFIRREKGKDVFFFYDDVLEGHSDILEGDIVEFEVRKEKKGPRAYFLKRVS
ncbi:TPA: retron Se72 family effector protein [Pseudomonas aeruginosa]|uniref:retron Se72 family effector protein n=1 Tax=Pseudomonas aeruginosa TaxID=287 RepID=UPI000A3C47BE|nr:retron Se72 family effector protein [Pseudomonas aeruginosa]ELP1285412.1 retron Se72 family effector protein [Pseudomonas aeruginosa]MBH3931702.1 cold shock domain-containing protein [Pseudomonas aeruginosa]MBH4379061.1 cold shock domain-containing protein [Pseudomonas aeruginosa]MBX5914051.1 cold shock domain-containing protein [Pseudomonas aeruginosa]MCC0132721.1 retron Se72 family effector protein [Pseudomonas aeruginosa]